MKGCTRRGIQGRVDIEVECTSARARDATAFIYVCVYIYICEDEGKRELRTTTAGFVAGSCCRRALRVATLEFFSIRIFKKYRVATLSLTMMAKNVAFFDVHLHLKKFLN